MCTYSNLEMSLTKSLHLLVLVAMLTALCSPLQAQKQSTITGRVTDAVTGHALRRATVKWVGTSVGALTDTDGTFTLQVSPESTTLQITYVGYEPFTVENPTGEVIAKLEPTTTEAVKVEGAQATISSAPMRTEVVSEKELSRAACCSLAESFERSPSVEVAYSDAVSGARTIRLLGLRGQYTQLLTETVPLMRAIETPFAMEHVPGPFMQSINISKGAGTVSNGYDGMVGAINVWTQDASTGPIIYANVYGNSMGRFEANLYGSQNVSLDLSTMTMLYGRMRNTSVDNNNDGFQDAPKIAQLNGIHKWYYNDEEYEAQLFFHGVLDQYSGGQIEPSQGSTRKYEINTDIERLEVFAKFGVLDLFESLDQSSAAIILSGGMHNSNSSFGLRSIDARERQFDAKAVLTARLTEELRINTGLTFRYDNVNERLLNDQTEQAGFSRHERVPGVYAEATYAPFEFLTMITGLRNDWHNLYGNYFTPRLHTKISLSDLTFFRASAGRGWRVPSVLSENLSSYINSRDVVFDDAFKPEESWNFGGSFTTTLMIANRPYIFDAEIYQTEFVNKVVVDYDRSARDLYVTNLDGRSYSTSFMAQIQATPFPRFDISIAYRWLDVRAPLGGVMQTLPMLSRNRGLLTASWESKGGRWQIDGSVTYFGGGRLPTTSENPTEYQKGGTFPGYWRSHAQVTYRFDFMVVYAGVENINNFIQQDPIIAADDPFGQYFDASLAWGPTMPRIAYLGVRYRLD